jgi:hypothetical protein
MGKTLYLSFYRKSTKRGIFCNQDVCKCTKERTRRHQAPVAEEDFSKPYNDTGLSIKQVRIKAEEGIIRRRKSIAEHPFGTIKRGIGRRILFNPWITHYDRGIFLTFPACNLKRVINTGLPKADGMPGRAGSPQAGDYRRACRFR